jgi:hypothetical protein
MKDLNRKMFTYNNRPTNQTDKDFKLIVKKEKRIFFLFDNDGIL